MRNDFSNNFYEAVNAEWLRSTSIPSSQSRYGQFDILTINNFNRITNLLTTLNDPILTPFYNTAMKQHLSTDNINTITKYIDSIKDNIISNTLADNMPSIFSIHVSADLSDNQFEMIYIDEPSLSLPNKHYYNNPKYSSFLNTYKQYVKDTIAKYNLNIPYDDVLKVETNIANLMMNKEDKRNIHTIYNKMSISNFISLAKNIDVENILQKFQQNFPSIKLPSDVIVTNTNLISKLHTIGTPLEISNFIKWSIYNSNLPYINQDTEEHYFQFYGKSLGGLKEMKTRDIRIISLMTNNLGDLLGYHYGKKYYTYAIFEKMQKMIDNIKEAMKNILLNLSWMSSSTKQKALEKLNSMKYKIGSPQKINDYSNLHLSGNLFNMLQQISKYNLQLEITKIGKPSDKDLWEIGAHEVNAYYSLVKNEIVFPAGILQPPFFDIDTFDEINYGAIGTIIGHEISHGFDDQGKKFNENGKLIDWWCQHDKDKYNKEADKMVKQFNNIHEEGHNINGKLTLGENLADLGGVQIALAALKKTKPNADLHAFFVSYATLWRQIIRKEEIVKRIKSDPHSLAKYRVNQILKNVPDFHTLYKIKPYHDMYLEKHHMVQLWRN